MSFLESISEKSNKFVLPEMNLVKVRLGRNTWGLAMQISIAYIETSDYDFMLNCFTKFCRVEGTNLVGSLDKIRLRKENRIVYRQRLVFTDLLGVLRMAKGLGLYIDEQLNLRLDDLLYYQRELKPLWTKSKSLYVENIEHNYRLLCLKQLEVLEYEAGIIPSVKIKDKDIGHLGSAPYIARLISKDKKTMSLFIPKTKEMQELYSGVDVLNFGYNSKTFK